MAMAIDLSFVMSLGVILSGDEVLGIVGHNGPHEKRVVSMVLVVGTVQCNAGLDFTLNSSEVDYCAQVLAIDSLPK